MKSIPAADRICSYPCPMPPVIRTPVFGPMAGGGRGTGGLGEAGRGGVAEGAGTGLGAVAGFAAPGAFGAAGLASVFGRGAVFGGAAVAGDVPGGRGGAARGGSGRAAAGERGSDAAAARRAAMLRGAVLRGAGLWIVAFAGAETIRFGAGPPFALVAAPGRRTTCFAGRAREPAGRVFPTTFLRLVLILDLT